MPIAKAAAPIVQRCPHGAIFLETESMHPSGRGSWYARVPCEHSIEDVLSPAYFGLVQTEGQSGKSLRAGDIIDVEPENARWRLQLRVMGLRFQTQQVLTREQGRWDFGVETPAGYRFIWDGAQAHWAVYKGETLIDSGFSTEDECLEYVEELKRAKVA